jgi:decaprenyl-phosphate phosphoribosyltransferase
MRLRPYIYMARPDHWTKNVFMLPGVAVAVLETNALFRDYIALLAVGLIAACLMASANYVINEYLDAKYDCHHPTKKNRPAVTETISPLLIIIEYVLLLTASLALGSIINIKFLITLGVFGSCGILYNVEPFRLKDIAYVDVLFESLNIVIRLLLGWFIVTDVLVPPLSLMTAFWMGGAFLMASKRFAEYRQIGDPERAAKYRRSFGRYSERSLLMSTVFYAVTFAFMFGIFLFKYRIEYILTFPMFSALFVWYLGLAMEPDSAVRDPEKLYKERTLTVYIAAIIIAILLLSFIDIPVLKEMLTLEYYK